MTNVRMPVEVRVYDPTGRGSFTVLPRRSGVKFTDVLNDAGSGEVTVPAGDQVFATNPGLLDYGAIVKYATPRLDNPAAYWEFAAWTVEQRKMSIVEDGGGGGYGTTMTVSGRGLLSLLENGLVLPFDGFTGSVKPTGSPSTGQATTMSGRPRRLGPNALPNRIPLASAEMSTQVRPDSKNDRHTGWMSASSDWMVGPEWTIPQFATIASRMRTPPSRWPDPSAQYMWPGPYGVRQTIGAGRALFRTTFTVSSEIRVQIRAVGDNTLRVYLDEQELITAQNYKETYNSPIVTIGAGNHVVAAEVVNWLSDPGVYNPAGLLMSIINVDTRQVLSRSAPAQGWVSTRFIPTGDPYLPGQSAAGILCEMMAEAADRGVAGLINLSRDFNEQTDSRGFTWPDHIEQSFTVGTDLLNLARQLGEAAFDLRVSPDMTLHAYLRLGDDFTTGSNPVVLRTGHNITSFELTEGGSKPRTHLVTQDQTGWSESESGAARGRYGLIEGYVQLGSSGSSPHTKVVASEALPYLGRQDHVATAAMVAVAGSTPMWDFEVGDRVLVPDMSGNLIPAEVASISGEEVADGDMQWTLELTLLKSLLPGGHIGAQEIPIDGAVNFIAIHNVRFDNGPIPSIKTATLANTLTSGLTLSGVDPGQITVVDGAVTFVAAQTLTLTGARPGPPTNDMFANATPIVITTDYTTWTSALIDNSTYTVESGEVFASDTKSAWWSYTPASPGTVVFDMTPMAGHGPAELTMCTWTAPNTGPGGTGFILNGQITSSTLTVNVTAGTTYWVKIGATTDANMTYQFTANGPHTA